MSFSFHKSFLCRLTGKFEALFRGRPGSENFFRRSGANRRRWPRIKCHHLVKCLEVNGQSRDWVTNLKNISRGGVKLLSPEPLRQRDKIDLMVNFPARDQNVRARASVMWISPNENRAAGYEVGLAFDEIQPGDQDVIGRFVDSNLHFSV